MGVGDIIPLDNFAEAPDAKPKKRSQKKRGRGRPANNKRNIQRQKDYDAGLTDKELMDKWGLTSTGGVRAWRNSRGLPGNNSGEVAESTPVGPVPDKRPTNATQKPAEQLPSYMETHISTPVNIKHDCFTIAGKDKGGPYVRYTCRNCGMDRKMREGKEPASEYCQGELMTPPACFKSDGARSTAVQQIKVAEAMGINTGPLEISGKQAVDEQVLKLSPEHLATKLKQPAKPRKRKAPELPAPPVYDYPVPPDGPVLDGAVKASELIGCQVILDAHVWHKAGNIATKDLIAGVLRESGAGVMQVCQGYRCAEPRQYMPQKKVIKAFVPSMERLVELEERDIICALVGPVDDRIKCAVLFE